MNGIMEVTGGRGEGARPQAYFGAGSVVLQTNYIDIRSKERTNIIIHFI